MKKFMLRAADLFAIERAAGTEKTRQYLGGVHVEIIGGKSGVMVATNGHILLAAVIEAHREDVKLTIPSAAIKFARKSHRKSEPLIELAEVGGVWSIGGHRFEPMDRFPDWRRVIPDAEHFGQRLDSVSFAPDYLQLFERVGQEVNSSAQVVPNGNDCAFVHFSARDDIFGLIMPRRYNYEIKAPDKAEVLTIVQHVKSGGVDIPQRKGGKIVDAAPRAA